VRSDRGALICLDLSSPLSPARRLRPADGMAFLPAALEIVETPPSPIGRAIALTVIAAF